MKRTLAIILSLMMILPCLAFNASAADAAVVYIDDINCYGSATIGPVLLYGSGVTANGQGVSAHTWWNKVVATFNPDDGSFVVTSVHQHAGVGDSSYLDVTLSDGQIMILTHSTFKEFDDTIAALTVGDKLYAYGFDFTNATTSNMISNNVSDVCFTTHEPILGDDYYGYVEGGTDDPDAPVIIDSNVVSLGAKVNTSLAGIRFGAEFTRDNNRGEVVSMGTLLLPADKLGNNELDLEYAETDSLVANVLASTIDAEDYVAGQSFEDYESFVYYVTVIGLNGYEDMSIVARPYVTYKSNAGIATYYGEATARTINEVAALAGN